MLRSPALNPEAEQSVIRLRSIKILVPGRAAARELNKNEEGNN